jgi:hypothetical protein
MKNLIALLLTFSAGGLFYVYVSPTYEEIKSLQIEKAEYDEALANSIKVQKARDELLGKYNAFQPSDLKRLEKLLPNHVDNIRLIIEIDGVAARYGMILKNVQVSAPAAVSASAGFPNQALGDTEAPPYGTAEFSFEVSGPYETYRSFVKDLEYSLRIIDITGISFTAGKGDEEKAVKDSFDRYDFKTSLETYWLTKK